MANAPFWTFPRIDNFGQIDPQGLYYKPDTNVLTPYGYPIQAILPGTVTDVRWTDFGQTMITIKLDTPLNAEATHTFYEHMHDADVTIGQHVSANELVGHANLQGEGANLGFGLYSGDVYGAGNAWSILQSDLAPGGPGLLNPVALLDAAKAGLPYQGLSFGDTGTTTGTTGIGLSSPFDLSWLTNSVFWQWISDPLRLFKLLSGLLLIILALLLLTAPDLVPFVK